jgi:hypothetical protein
MDNPCYDCPSRNECNDKNESCVKLEVYIEKVKMEDGDR